MTAKGDKISYCSSLIEQMKRKIKEASDDVNYYNDITYSMYIIAAISHELWHCKQEMQNAKGIEL